jgi:hypothetical protein
MPGPATTPARQMKRPGDRERFMTRRDTGRSLTIAGHRPHLEASVPQVPTVPCGKFRSLVIKRSSVLSFLESRLIAK